MRTMKNVLLLSGVAVSASLIAACSWGRFTKLKKNAPMVRLEPPKEYSTITGFSLATAKSEYQVELYLGSRAESRGGLVYDIGVNESPYESPSDERHCLDMTGDDACSSLKQPAGLNRSWVPGQEPLELCFISGYGAIKDNFGLWTRCQDDTRFVFPVPDDVENQLQVAPDFDNPRNLQVTNNRSGDQLIFASAGSLARAWFYPVMTGDAIDVPTPTQAAEGIGSAVAVAKSQAGFLLAWGAAESVSVHLYLVQADNSVQSLGCLSGAEDFGRTLASGDVDGDGQEDLVIADAEGVHALSGAELVQLSDTGSCVSVASTGSELTSMSCETAEDSDSCANSNFGGALAVFDSNGDGKGEIAIAASEMRVRGESEAGAVLVFDSAGEFLQKVFVSNPHSGDHFGASLSAVVQEEREILAIGASGADAVYVHYCAGEADSSVSSRCAQ